MLCHPLTVARSPLGLPEFGSAWAHQLAVPLSTRVAPLATPGLLSPGAIVTTVFALVGAFGVVNVARWLWGTFIRPAVFSLVLSAFEDKKKEGDALILAAFVRNRPEVEDYLRENVFKEDIEARVIRDREIAEALVIAKEASARTEIIMRAHDEINEKLDVVLPMCRKFDDFVNRLDRMDERGDQTKGMVERILGRLEERDKWDGIHDRRRH